MTTTERPYAETHFPFRSLKYDDYKPLSLPILPLSNDPLYSWRYIINKLTHFHSSLPQIYFHGKDHKLLRSQVGDECLPTRYGGKVIIPEGTGIQLANLFQLYSKDFESKFNVQSLFV